MRKAKKTFKLWRSRALKNRHSEVGTDGDIVLVRLGRRLTPEVVGESRRVEPLPRHLSGNRRMVLTEFILSPESAVELHSILGAALKDTGLIKPSFTEEVSTGWWSRFIARMYMAIMARIYFDQMHIVTQTRKRKAPA